MITSLVHVSFKLTRFYTFKKNTIMDSEVSSSGVVKKSSLGKQCVAFGFYNSSYIPDGMPTGLHYFKFLQKKPEKRLWCNLIKRVDGLDGFRVTESTRLCQEHYKDSDIKQNPM